MGADAFYVVYGVRYEVRSETELDALENRTDPRIQIARRARLKCVFGRLTEGGSHFLLIGSELGRYGVENQSAGAFADSDIQRIISETRAKLAEAGIMEEPNLYFQLVAQY